MHFRRKKPATRTFRKGRDLRRDAEKGLPDWVWLNSWPAHHDILSHRRPPRRRDKRLERSALMDRVDADSACWPDWRRPHDYWW